MTDSPPDGNTRGLLRSMLVIASAQSLSIAIRILKAKLIAVMLGPSGTGLLSVFANLQMLGGQAAGLGVSQSGVRDIAAARGNKEKVARLRRVLGLSLALQGGIAMVVIWLLREQLSVWLLGEARQTTEVGLVGVAVLLFLVASSQQTLLRGTRRIGDLGRVMVLGTLAGAVVGVAAVWLMGQEGLIWLLLVEPLAAFLIALIYIRRLRLPKVAQPSFRETWLLWRPMVGLGLSFMVGALLTTATLLVVRTIITRDLGLGAAGQFAAAWTITMSYVGFLLQAMSADYFPRLSEIIHDRDAANRLINDQIQLVLALGGPILLLMIGLAPWVISLLYSAEFDSAASVLQWQTAANVLKIAVFALGILFVASARPWIHLYLQIQFNILFLGAIWLGLPVLGIEATGVGFLMAYVVHVPTVLFLARKLQGFRWNPNVLQLFVTHALLAVALLAIARTDFTLGAITSILVAFIMALIGGHGVIARLGPRGRHISRIAKLYKLIGFPIDPNE